MQTILVCDDDKEIVEAIQIYLEQEGYEVLTAYDGMQALAQIRQNRDRSSGDRCHDAEVGRHPCNDEDPGGE